MILRTLLLVFVPLLCYSLHCPAQWLYHELTSPLRHLPGPRNPSLLYGNTKEMLADFGLVSQWRTRFGRVFRFWGLFSISEIYISDLKALAHILNDNVAYRKPPFMLEKTRISLGGGSVLDMELDDHKRHRRVLNQAFGPAQIRPLTDVFMDKAIQLRDIWAGRMEAEGDATRIDISDGLRRATLDVIGQAGFHYQFNALEDKPNELNDTFTLLHHSSQSKLYDAVRMTQAKLPMLKLFPLPGAQFFRRGRAIMDSIGRTIVSDTKAALKKSENDENQGTRRDLLSVLLKANLSNDLPSNQRMSDTEIMAQIRAFLFAGHETTSSSVSWVLYELSVHPNMQEKLREELFSLPTEAPTMDQLNSLKYLESVVRETLRLRAPVISATRMAMRDDVLPLSKPYIDRRGNTHQELLMPRGQVIHIPILAVNTDKETWGADALEFKPDRWDALPDAVTSIPGVWANLLTFYAGPHACIGYRFSLVEMKALLFVLLRAFEFAPAVREGGIVPQTHRVMQNPGLLVADEKGEAFPLLVKPCRRN
ncbi:cytochrome P450 [Roridomyces roridus]|uniref:Cytochrome P450 n=1 Tax=Roridomyces roridus TaxID=1738132 RepID=A0AAD7B6C3_9AGAR|nr:cytochrome P450 [Roridomyces roridus]